MFREVATEGENRMTTEIPCDYCRWAFRKTIKIDGKLISDTPVNCGHPGRDSVVKCPTCGIEQRQPFPPDKCLFFCRWESQN
jgi:hypothetical protein